MGARLMRLPEVLMLTGLSKSKIYALIADDAFPKQTKLAGGRSVAWPAADVEAWVRAHLGDSGLEPMEETHGIGEAADKPQPEVAPVCRLRFGPFNLNRVAQKLTLDGESEVISGS